jgi:hypothetical protein
MIRRAFLSYALLVVAVVALAWLPSDARASVSVAVTFEALLGDSVAAAVGTPVRRQSVWEDGRIYSYAEVHVDRLVAGRLEGETVWVRTMGGVVGNIGQRVEGEAVLLPGEPSLLFLHAGPVGAFDVTARGQGQFPIVADDTGQRTRVVRSNAMGMIVERRPAAAGRRASDVLHGRSVEDAAHAISAAWDAVHAR